jgi:hypothetical protein
MAGIISGIDPMTIHYPEGEHPAFTQDDLTTVTTQLKRERQYLQNAANYASALKEINTNATMNIGSSVQSAATSVAATMTQMTSSPGNSDLSLASSVLGTASGVTAIVGVAFPPAAVVSGVLGTASSILGIVGAAQPQPDPQVTKLANLLAENGGKASEYAVRFNSSVQSSTGMYFNDVYSDWFKLQTVGLMSVTPDSGWYYSTVGNSLTDFNKSFIAQARTSFFEQVLPQYAYEARICGVPKEYTVYAAAAAAGLHKSVAESPYAWGVWSTAGHPQYRDYTFMAIKNSNKGWPNSLGETLTGPADLSNPNGNLGIPTAFLYDTGGFEISDWSSSCSLIPYR